jgi:hypothetical protein
MDYFNHLYKTAISFASNSMANFLGVIIEYPVFFAVISIFSFQGMFIFLRLLRDYLLDYLYRLAMKNEQEHEHGNEPEKPAKD